MLLLSFSIFAVMSLCFKSFFICQVFLFMWFLVFSNHHCEANHPKHSNIQHCHFIYYSHILWVRNSVMTWVTRGLGHLWLLHSHGWHLGWDELRLGLSGTVDLGTHVWPIHVASFNMTRELFLWQGASGEYIFQDTQVEAAWFYMT